MRQARARVRWIRWFGKVGAPLVVVAAALLSPSAALAAPVPAVTEATVVGPHRATVNGTVNPNGSSTIYQFEYGTTTSYGTVVGAAVLSSGSTPVPVSYPLNELLPNTVYHFRLMATSGGGNVYSKDLVLRTPRAGAPTSAFSFGSVGTGNGQFQLPTGLAMDKNGTTLYVADTENNRVQKFNSKGEYLSQFGAKGSGNGQFSGPRGVAIDSKGNVYVADTGNNRVQKFSSAGAYVSQFGSLGSGAGQFSGPQGIAIDASDNVVVADTGNNRIQQFSSAGGYLSQFGTKGSGNGQFSGPRGVAVDSNPSINVVDTGNNRIQRFTMAGAYLSQYGTLGSGNEQFNTPTSLTSDFFGSRYVSDSTNNRVQIFSSGTYLTQFGSGFGQLGGGAGELPGATGIAAGYVDGNIYVSQPTVGRISKWQKRPSPEAFGLSAAGIGTESATLKAKINPEGQETTYRFEYGATDKYGSSIPVSPKAIGSGTTDVEVSQSIAGLIPFSEYHYRIVATNAAGTAYTQDKTFKTLVEPISEKLTAMGYTNRFDGSAASNSNFATRWGALPWASSSPGEEGPGGPAIGETSATGWHAVASYPTINGAFFNGPVADTGPGTGASATMAANPGVAGRYFSLWLHTFGSYGSPTARYGYQLKFTYVSTNTYKVTLSKWVAETETVLATKESLSFANGNSLALVDEGETVSAWSRSGSSYTRIFQASDAAYSYGDGAVEAAGNNTRLTNFKVGQMLSPVNNMDEALKKLQVVDSLERVENPLWFENRWEQMGWIKGNTGEVGLSGWEVAGPDSGALWNSNVSTDSGAGSAVSVELDNLPDVSGYFALDLDIPQNSSVQSGYEARFTQTSWIFSEEDAIGVFDVTLSKWQAGVKTTLASKTGFKMSVYPGPANIALVQKGGTVSVWTRTNAAPVYAQLLSAADSAFYVGFSAFAGSGNTHVRDFSTGPLPPF
jgi:DNA-binding beta-propeller fold protein YncE